MNIKKNTWYRESCNGGYQIYQTDDRFVYERCLNIDGSSICFAANNRISTISTFGRYAKNLKEITQDQAFLEML